jgi:hypothetical protein
MKIVLIPLASLAVIGVAATLLTTSAPASREPACVQMIETHDTPVVHHRFAQPPSAPAPRLTPPAAAPDF